MSSLRILVFCLLLPLWGCGQQGALYLPEEVQELQLSQEPLTP